MNCCKQHELNCLLMHREVQFMSRKAQFTKSQISIHAVRQFIEKEINFTDSKIYLFFMAEMKRFPFGAVVTSIHSSHITCSNSLCYCHTCALPFSVTDSGRARCSCADPPQKFCVHKQKKEHTPKYVPLSVRTI